jgi:hypothetical protein
MDEICKLRVSTRDYLNNGLHAQVRRQYGKLLAAAAFYNQSTAWDYLYGGLDTPENRRSRIAWIDLAVYPKAVLCTPPGAGKDKRGEAYAWTKSRLDRWEAGERESLFSELLWRKQPKKRTDVPAGDEGTNAKQQRAIAQASKGRPRQSADALTSPGLCPHTAKVERLLREKNPPAPEGSASRRRPPAPAATILEPGDVAKSVLSFSRGTGSGPTQASAELLRITIGDGGQEDELQALTALANAFAQGRVPRHLAKYYAGGNLVATGKHGKGLEEDTRPIVSGEILQRMVGIVLLKYEKTSLRENLEPHQFAVGTPAGGEAYVHLIRQWFLANEGARTKALLEKDKKNAFNIVDRNKMLMSSQEHMPGASAFAEWCYAEPSNLYWSDVVIRSECGCHQGCPLAMALYCNVAQQLREHTGIVESSSAGAPTKLNPKLNLDISASFADDGTDGGDISELKRGLQAEMELARSLGLEFQMDKMKLTPTSGQACTEDLSWFRDQGITINMSQCVEIAKVPIGTAEFTESVVEGRMQKVRAFFWTNSAIFLISTLLSAC